MHSQLTMCTVTKLSWTCPVLSVDLAALSLSQACMQTRVEATDAAQQQARYAYLMRFSYLKNIRCLTGRLSNLPPALTPSPSSSDWAGLAICILLSLESAKATAVPPAVAAAPSAAATALHQLVELPACACPVLELAACCCLMT